MTKLTTISLCGLVTAALLTPSTGQAQENILAQRWCSPPGQYVQHRGSSLIIDFGGDEVTFGKVAFAGCKDKVCSYSQPKGFSWKVQRIGTDIQLRGPVQARGGKSETLRFGPCTGANL